MNNNTHDTNDYPTVIYACFGGFSNTGITTGHAGVRAVEVTLNQASIGFLTALSQGVKSVINSTQNAEKVLTIDGCAMKCTTKEVEKQGINPESIVLTKDLGIKKRSFKEVFKGGSEKISDYLNDSEIEKTANIVIERIVNKEKLQ